MRANGVLQQVGNVFLPYNRCGHGGNSEATNVSYLPSFFLRTTWVCRHGARHGKSPHLQPVLCLLQARHIYSGIANEWCSFNRKSSDALSHT